MALTYEPIATNTLGSATGSVTFSSIPQTYTDLVLKIQVGGASSSANIQVRFNGDSGTNYNVIAMYAYNDSSKAGGSYQNLAHGYGGNVALAMGTSLQGISIINIFDYTSTNKFKNTYSNWGYANSISTAETNHIISQWRNTSAITSINISSYSANYITGSTFTLYGIKAA